jgi:hypothetical protein
MPADMSDVSGHQAGGLRFFKPEQETVRPFLFLKNALDNTGVQRGRLFIVLLFSPSFFIDN